MPQHLRDANIAAITEHLQIKRWSCLLVGDGSGSAAKDPCGWGCVAVERHSMARQYFYGAANRGSINFAEIMAYLQPLTWYVDKELEAVRVAAGGRHIHIITDSQYCQSVGNNPGLIRKKNILLWTMLDTIKRQGFSIDWHWLPREALRLNMVADAMSKKARKLVVDDLKTAGAKIAAAAGRANPT
jgi:ribonuclease HI